MEITIDNRFQITHASEPFKSMGFKFVVFDVLGEYGSTAATDWEDATTARGKLRASARMTEQIRHETEPRLSAGMIGF